MSEYESWIGQAKQYVTNAKTLAGVDDHEAMVELQQACEYTLKAVQVARTGESDLGHDVSELQSSVGAPSRFTDLLSDLTQAYDRRYPDDPDFEEVGMDGPLTYVSEVNDLIV